MSISISCISVADDINPETGATFVWHFKDGPEYNTQHFCGCIWRALTSMELFGLMTEQTIQISDQVFNAHFIEIKPGD